MSILVTGATGFIGGEVVSVLLAAGHEVRTLARRDWAGPPHVPLRHRFFGRLPLDLPAGCLDGVEAVVHCAAVSDPSERRSRAVNVVGTLALARAARQAGARSFVFLSSQSARPDAASAYGRSKHEAERELLALEGLDVIVLRPGLVCGRGGLFGRMIGLVQRLPVVPVLAGGALVQPILVDDLVRAIVRCLEEARALAGGVYSLGDPAGTTLREMLGLIAREVSPGASASWPCPRRLSPSPCARPRPCASLCRSTAPTSLAHARCSAWTRLATTSGWGCRGAPPPRSSTWPSHHGRRRDPAKGPPGRCSSAPAESAWSMPSPSRACRGWSWAAWSTPTREPAA